MSEKRPAVMPQAVTEIGQLTTELQQARQDLAARDARIAELEAGLPVTADGVHLIVGSEVWLPGYQYPGYVEYIMDDLVAVNDMTDWPSAGCDTIREYTVRHPASLYSTREAAEAASAAQSARDAGEGV